MKKYYWVGLTGLLAVVPTWANVIPDAGQLLQEQQWDKPILAPSKSQLETVQPESKGLSGDLQIEVKQFQLEGYQQFSYATLHQLIADAEGSTLSLSQLQTVVDRITAYYQARGYLYSRAYLPQQTLSGGVVKIVILEAKIDRVNINNQSQTRESLVEATLAPLKSGEHLEESKIQKQLKLLNRLNGVSSHNVLAPGVSTGTSQLNIQVQNRDRIEAVLGMDNSGNEFVGEYRFYGTVAFNNLAGLGDQLNFSAMGTGEGMNYAKLGYQFTVNGLGTQLGLSHSYLDYDLGKAMKALDAEGSASNSSVWLNHPILYNNLAELVLTTQYDHKVLKDDIRVNQSYKHRNVDLLSLRLDGSNYDGLGGGGLNQYGISTGYGRVDYRNETAARLDSLTANSAGSFYTTSIYMNRLQQLTEQGTQGFLSVFGQYSSENLDSSEQYMLGGAMSVRGYKNSQLSGSSGYLATAEIRQPLYRDARQQFSAKVFTDYGRVQLNAKPWIGLSTKNYVNLSSVGLGAQWNHVWKIQAQIDVAFPLGDRPGQLAERDDAQYWFNLKKSF